MSQYNGNYTDENGRPVKGAAVFVYTSEGATAAITDANDNPITQPLLTDEDGNYSYRADDGYYMHHVWVAKRRVLIENEVIIGPSYRDAAQAAAAAAAAAAGVGEFDDTADGLAGTELTETFWVDNGDGTGTIYRHDPGPVATEIGKFVQDQTAPGAANLLAGGVPTSAALAGPGGSGLVSFLQSGADAIARTVEDKLRGFVDVLDFIPVNLHAGIRAATNATDLKAYIQKALDSLQVSGGTLYFPRGLYLVGGTLSMRSGVSLLGTGSHIEFDGGVQTFGSWLKYTGPADEPFLDFYNIQSVNFQSLGILCNEGIAQTAIAIGSNNAPAAKRLTFIDFMIVAANIGVQWGNSNADNPDEQCDDMTFDRGWFISCGDSMIIDAANAADFSEVKRCSFYNVKRTAVWMKKSAFMLFDNCASGLLFSTSCMFRLEGEGPDQYTIRLCQSEGPAGDFIVYAPGGLNEAGTAALSGNDQGAPRLETVTANQPIRVFGITRMTAANSFFNSTVHLNGYVRWEGSANNWDGLYGSPRHAQQVFVTGAVQFHETVTPDAAGHNGKFMPVGMKIEKMPSSGGYGGEICTTAGIKAAAFVPTAEYVVGQYVRPAVSNGYAHLVTVAGTAGGSVPDFPEVIGDTVVSGTVTFQCVGAVAVMNRCDAVDSVEV